MSHPEIAYPHPTRSQAESDGRAPRASDPPTLRRRAGATGLALSALLLVACSREGNVARLPESAPATAAPGATGSPKAAATEATAASGPASSTAADDTGRTASLAGSSFLSGQTEAHRRSTLTPEVSSTVTRVHVRDGDVVRKGQALVTLDTQNFALRTQQAEAALTAAKVQLDSARLDWNRSKALLAEKAVPQSQFDAVDARYKAAQAGVAQAQVAVALSRKALHDAIIRAPFNGVIVKRLVSEGEYASVMPATPLVVIEEVDPLDLRVQIPSTDLTRVKVGAPVHVRFPATGQALDARLTRIVSAVDPRTRTFAAIAELPNHDRALRSGLYAEVTLESPKAAASATAGNGKVATRKVGRRSHKDSP